MNKVTAPFTPDQVKAFNRYQRSGIMHPFTCPKRHYGVRWCSVTGDDLRGPLTEDEILDFEEDHAVIIYGDHLNLVAYEDALICPGQSCNYTQEWCWDLMVDMERLDIIINAHNEMFNVETT